ncbi:MAG: hypothetical protein ACIAQF_05645 [Phycisphaerales bacterium JB065]
MTTKPETVNAILEALIDPDATYRAIAKVVGMTLDELFELLETPEMQAKIQRMQRLLDQRAALLTAANEAEAMGTLAYTVQTIRADEKHRAELFVERTKARMAGEDATVREYDSVIRDLDARFRRLAEAARSARATLLQARAARSRSGSRAGHRSDPSIPIGEAKNGAGAHENRPPHAPVHAAA